MLVELPKVAVLNPNWWAISPPVARLTKPERAARGGSSEVKGLWVDALAELKNSGEHELSYDDWVHVVFAIWEETGGSEDGLALAHEFSARSSKYVAAFLDDRVWPYVKAGGGITGGTIMSLAARLHGWRGALDESAFDVVDDGGVYGSAVGRGTPSPSRSAARGTPGLSDPDHADSGSAGETSAAGADAPVFGVGGGSGIAPALAPAVDRRGVPPAQHLCTDQANAGRLVKAFGSRVLVAAGKWHVWDGRRWKSDEADVYRYASQMSRMVKEEAAEVRRRARDVEVLENSVVSAAEEKAEALEKWSTRCESKASIDACVGLARKMLTVDAGLLDRDPWLLNCRNGVVDLRDGSLRPHSADDLMTRLVDVDYVAGTRCEAWEKALAEICGGDAGVVAFLGRWFGYCLTGWTREQAFVVHWGDGSNGKSTVLDLMARTLGDYSGTAAPGLLAGSDRGGDRHPTEIAALMGRRMVTAHESGEGVVLREEFIKQATGDDVMTARYMREDFFDFRPTHKLQLLTNHKPVIKGQDRGIWRRVLLVPYVETFGDAGEVAAGLATRVRDRELLERLGTREALEGVLAWRVRGAVEWAGSGLRAPDAVLDASARYQSEQDRVRQWVGECCEVDQTGGLGWSEPMTSGMGGLYPAYSAWCRESGWHPVGRNKFVGELQRVSPRFQTMERDEKTDSGARRRVLRVKNLRLLPD